MVPTITSTPTRLPPLTSPASRVCFPSSATECSLCQPALAAAGLLLVVLPVPDEHRLAGPKSLSANHCTSLVAAACSTIQARTVRGIYSHCRRVCYTYAHESWVVTTGIYVRVRRATPTDGVASRPVPVTAKLAFRPDSKGIEQGVQVSIFVRSVLHWPVPLAGAGPSCFWICTTKE
jgi:hypothetical protein